MGWPVGKHVELPDWMTTGTPVDITRVAPTVHWPVAQGALPPLASAHPATTYGVAMVVIGWPDTVTRGDGADGEAWPACEHITVAPT
jgi:hypothetical protein